MSSTYSTEYREQEILNNTYQEDLKTLGTSSGLSLPRYDYFSVATPNDTTEVYTFKTGGSSGTTVATLTIVYTDSGKETISSLTKS